MRVRNIQDTVKKKNIYLLEIPDVQKSRTEATCVDTITISTTCSFLGFPGGYPHFPCCILGAKAPHNHHIPQQQLSVFILAPSQMAVQFSRESQSMQDSRMEKDRKSAENLFHIVSGNHIVWNLDISSHLLSALMKCEEILGG